MNKTQIHVLRSTRNADQSTPVSLRVSELEWQARMDLAALYRLVAHFGWTDTIYNHISLRVPGEDHFLINPFGYLYEEITASSLVKINFDGEVVDDPTEIGINLAGWVIHGAIHLARHDINCVIHTHSRAGAAVSAHKRGLLPISAHAAMLGNGIGYHDFEGIVLDEDERPRLIGNLGSNYVMILRNHGLLTAGRNAAEAFYYMTLLERACQIQIDALAGGAEVNYLSPEVVAKTNGFLKAVNGEFSRDWAAMLRLVERVAPDFRD